MTMSTAFSIDVIFSVPIDLPIIRREHFNRWYSVSAHYIALNLADIPILIVCSILFTVIAYTMSNHPLEDFRILTVIAIGLAMSFTSQAYGIFAGSLFPLKVRVANTCSERINCTSFSFMFQLGLLFAALLMVYQIIFAGGLVFMKDVSKNWHWMFEVGIKGSR